MPHPWNNKIFLVNVNTGTHAQIEEMNEDLALDVDDVYVCCARPDPLLQAPVGCGI